MDEPQQKTSEELLKDCEAQRDEYLNSWKRSVADLINYKKDDSRRLEEFGYYVNNRIMKDLLPVLDSFNLALASEKSKEITDKGLTQIKSQLDDFLRKQNVEKIVVSPGDAVDLNLHEPVVEEESKEYVGKIIEELSPGYTLNGRVIRAVKVTVGKQSS